MTLPERPELPAGVPAPPPAAWPPPAWPEPAGTPGGDDESLASVPLWAPAIPLVLMALLIWAAYAAPEDSSGSVDLDAVALVVAIVVQGALLLGVAFGFTIAKAGSPVFRRLGARRIPLGTGVGKAAAAYGTFWMANLVLLLVFNPDDEKQDLVEQLEDETDVAVLVVLAVMTTVLAPLIEETFFRGFLFGVLRTRIPLVPAVVIAGTIFGFVHLPAPAVAVVVLSGFGIALCVLYHWSGSLLPCLGLHAVHNAITFSVTKGLPWWGSIAIIVTSCVIVVAVGALFARSRSPSPSPSH